MKNETIREKNRSRTHVRSVRSPLGSGAGAAGSGCTCQLFPALEFPLSAQLRFLIIRRLGVLDPISVTPILE